jgi:hypothetical protein
VVSPGPGARTAADTVDENPDLPMPPLPPGAVLEQMQQMRLDQLQQMQLGAETMIRSGQVQIQMSPGMQIQSQPAGQGAQPLPYTPNPGMPTATPGSAAPGMPTGATTLPGMMPPGTTATPPKPIKPPGHSD